MAFVVVGVLIATGTTIYIFNLDNSSNNQYLKLAYLGINAYLAFSVYRFWKQLRENNAALLLTSDSLIYHENGTEQRYKWNDIQDVQIDWEESSTYLKLITTSGEKKVGISFLEKSPKQIKGLVEEYRHSAAANRSF